VRILFLNQYFPPDPAPTGVLLKELADHLQAAGHTVDFVAARQDYRAGQRKGGRMKREALALARMLIDGLRRTRPDVVLSATSPPCLLLVGTFLAWWHRAKSVHWIMDLYPEIAVALGEIRAGALAGLLRKWMGFAYRRAAAVVVLDEDMARRLAPTGAKVEIIRPWVFSSVLEVLARTTGEPQPPWTWIYSGNLGRAHEWETLLAAQAILEKRGAGLRLLFQGGGPSRPAAEARAQSLGLRDCSWADYVPEAELPASLLRANVLVVTQLPAAQGLLWPSKLGLILSLPRPILWVGPKDGAIACMLRPLPQAGVFAPGEAAQMADWLVARKSNVSPVVAALDPAAHRQIALGAWQSLLDRFA
jgi:glycosyltransferase involved in cell wall biosynthesis